MTTIAKLDSFALDCADPRSVAEFYSALTGLAIERDDGEWVQLVRPDGGATLAFQRALGHQPPVWPSDDRPQQAHLDLEVDDLDDGEKTVLDLGGRKADTQPSPDSFRVYLDPAGHPFCLVLA